MAGKQMNPYKKPYKEIAKTLSPCDTAAILDMTTTVLKNLNGRPATYPATDEGLKVFIENSKSYFTYVQSANSQLEEKEMLIPDIESYCVFLGISRVTLKTYGERNEEWKKVIDLFKETIAANKKQLMLKGKIPAIMGIFDLTNNHNYCNSSEFKLTTNNTVTESRNKDYSSISKYRLPDVVPTEEEPQ